MKQLPVRILLFILAAGIANGAEYLIRVDNLTEEDFTVIQRIEDHFILLADEHEISLLNQRNIPYKILDVDPKEKLYFLVFPIREDETAIARFGTIIDRYEECLLLRTTEDKIEELNNLKVELSRLFLTPANIDINIQKGFERYGLTVDTLIEKMVNAVSQDSIHASILRMQQMYTRYATSDSNKLVAVPWIRDRLIAYGCDSVYLHTFSGSYGPNIVGIKRGIIYPDWTLYCVICGHMDDVPSSGYAPGADDNASGTTAVLEAARVMKDYIFEYTIRYIAFNAEEQGLIGSDYYATNARNQGDSILGVFNFDMIGYVASPNRDTMRAYYTTAVPGCSVFVCDFLQTVADTYTQLKILQVRRTGTGGASDHASFWRRGYIAMLGIERVLCPGYHTIGDTIGPTGVNDFPFATKVIKTGTAALAKLAVPIHSGPGVEDKGQKISKSLFYIHPNPSNYSKFFFQTQKDNEFVTLVVYNVVGQLIHRLTDDKYKEGIHSLVWDACDTEGNQVPEGVYFVTLTRGEEEFLRKVILVR
jgi:hypothetical protein